MANSQQLVIYVGRDASLFTDIKQVLRAEGFEVEWAEDRHRMVEELIADWYRVVLLDVDANDGLEPLRAIRAYHACVPVVVLAAPEDFRLTKVGLARLDGAEALVLKPLTNPTALVEVCQDAFRRLDRWRRVFDELSARRESQSTEDPRASDVATRLESLSPREREVMDLLVQGKHVKVIAMELNLSPKTIEHHRVNILKKMCVENVVELVRLVLMS